MFHHIFQQFLQKRWRLSCETAPPQPYIGCGLFATQRQLLQANRTERRHDSMRLHIDRYAIALRISSSCGSASEWEDESERHPPSSRAVENSHTHIFSPRKMIRLCWNWELSSPSCGSSYNRSRRFQCLQKDCTTFTVNKKAAIESVEFRYRTSCAFLLQAELTHARGICRSVPDYVRMSVRCVVPSWPRSPH